MSNMPRTNANQRRLVKSSSQHGHGKSVKVTSSLIGSSTPKKKSPRRRPAMMKMARADAEVLRELDLLMTTADAVIVVEGQKQTKVSGKSLQTIKRVVHVLGSTDDDANLELTSQEVADRLNVSRPHVIKLAKEGRLPHHMVGNRHRFFASDVFVYQEKQAAERELALRALTPKGGYTAEDF